LYAELLPGIYLVASGRFNFGHPINCNVYLVKGTSQNVLIDGGCGFGVAGLVESLDAYGCDPSDIDMILLTHTHWDHARGCSRLVELGIPTVGVHHEGLDQLTVGQKWYEFGFEAAPEVTYQPVAESDVQLLENDQIIDLGDRALRVLHTPGHTPDSLCFMLEEEGRRYAFTGDTVCAFGAPGVMTAETDFRSYRDSLLALHELRVDGMFPGHGLWLEEYAYDHVAVLADRLSAKWTDLAPHPKPLDSGIWVLRSHPELVTEDAPAEELDIS
jgi:glyoxylase-like metal-dependent hydrolase (beta-lactamase superfamily II)